MPPKRSAQVLCDIVTEPDTEVPQHCTSLPFGHAVTQQKKFKLRVRPSSFLVTGLPWSRLPFRHLRGRKTRSWWMKGGACSRCHLSELRQCNIERTAQALTSLCCRQGRYCLSWPFISCAVGCSLHERQGWARHETSGWLTASGLKCVFGSSGSPSWGPVSEAWSALMGLALHQLRGWLWPS